MCKYSIVAYGSCFEVKLVDVEIRNCYGDTYRLSVVLCV